jgi:itaconate CoA-transferase
VPALWPPGTGDGVKARMDAVPSVGDHNEAILKELGIER